MLQMQMEQNTLAESPATTEGRAASVLERMHRETGDSKQGLAPAPEMPSQGCST